MTGMQASSSPNTGAPEAISRVPVDPGPDSEGIDLAAKTLAAVRKSNRGNGNSTVRRRQGSMAQQQFSGSHADDRDPTRASVAVAGLIEDRGWRMRTRTAAVIGRWSEVAGQQLADHVQPVRFDEEAGSLMLQADSTAWATQTRVLIPHLLLRLDQMLEPGMVRQIEVAGPSTGRRGFGRLRVPGRGPRDTYG